MESNLQVGELLAEFVNWGWTVTFRPFQNTRTYTVEASKGETVLEAGWLANERSLQDAMQNLMERARLDPTSVAEKAFAIEEE